jgi:hypothetical protein
MVSIDSRDRRRAFGVASSGASRLTERLRLFRVYYTGHVTTKGCWYYAYAALKEIGRQRAVKQDWDRAPEVSRYNADSRSAIHTKTSIEGVRAHLIRPLA